MINALTLKFIILFGTWAITVLASLAPLKLDTEKERVKSFLDHFAYLTGGIFLGAGLLHLLPDSVQLYESVDGATISNSNLCLDELVCW